MPAFAQHLAELIREKGWTQLEAASNLGVSQTLISRYLSGKREPLPRTVQHIAAQLGIDASELMGEKTTHDKVKRPRTAAPSRQRAYPDDVVRTAMQDLKARWNRRPQERDAIRHLIAVLFPGQADQILAWLDRM